MRTAALRLLLDEPDPARVDAEVALYAGRNADDFVATLERMRTRRQTGWSSIWPASWHWPAITGAAWFLFRKCFLTASCLTVLPLIAVVVFGRAGFVVALALWVSSTIWAKALYVRGALSRIATADALGLAGERRREFVCRRGGTSRAALVLGLVMIFGLPIDGLMLAVLAIKPQSLAGMPHGTPPSHLAAPVLAFAAVAPAVLILCYGVFRTHAHWRRESLWAALMLGTVAAVAAMMLELVPLWMPLPGWLPPIANAARLALGAGIFEEGTKLFVLLAVIGPSLDFRRPHDWPLLGLAVGVGFAAFENIAYVLSIGNAASTALARALTAVPMHAAQGMIMGTLVAAAHRSAHPRRWIVAAFVVPAALHAAYDFPLLARMTAHAAGWPLPVFAVMLIVVGCLGVLMLSWSARATESDLAEGDLRRRHTVWLGWTLIICGCFWLYLAMNAAAPSGADADVGEHIRLILLALSVFPLAAGIDLIQDGGRRHRHFALIDANAARNLS